MNRLPNDKITQSFTDGYNKAQAFYASDQLQECIDEARNLIAEPAIPRYHRIRTLLLLGSTVPQWAEAWQFHKEAQMLWHLVRRYHPIGEDIGIDDTMEQLWTSIATLKEVLHAEAPDEVDNSLEDDNEVEEELVAHAAAEQQKAEEDAALEEADRKALGATSIEEMRIKTDSKAAKNNPEVARKPKLMENIALRPATVTTSTDLSTGQTPVFSAQAQETFSASKSYGFGGSKPYKPPSLKKELDTTQEPDPAGPVDASMFLIPGGHEALPTRARSIRSKHQSLKLPQKRLQPSLHKPTTLQANRPPPVQPKFITEIFGDASGPGQDKEYKE